jgi:hypothetical protein
MCFDWADTLLLMAHTKKTPEDASWSAVCRSLADTINEKGAIRTLVFTDGGGPSSSQRQEMANLVHPTKYRAAVFSTAPSVRFIVTSLTFINPMIRSFAPNEWQRGLEHLGATGPAEQMRVEQAVQRFAKRIGDRFATLNAVLARSGMRATGS